MQHTAPGDGHADRPWLFWLQSAKMAPVITNTYIVCPLCLQDGKCVSAESESCVWVWQAAAPEQQTHKGRWFSSEHQLWYICIPSCPNADLKLSPQSRRGFLKCPGWMPSPVCKRVQCLSATPKCEYSMASITMGKYVLGVISTWIRVPGTFGLGETPAFIFNLVI